MFPRNDEFAAYRTDPAKPLARVHPIVWAQAILFTSAVVAIALLIYFGKH